MCRFDSFDNIVDTFVPVSDGADDKCYISKSYDASRCDCWCACLTANVLASDCAALWLAPHSHFESATADILNLYQRVTGSPLNLDISTDFSGDE